MAIVKLILDVKTAGQIAASTLVLDVDEPVYRDDGYIAFGDGVTQLNALVFKPIFSGGGVASVSGTLNRIDVDNTDPLNPIVDISSGYDATVAALIDIKADKTSQLLTGGVISIGSYGGGGSNNDIRVTASTFYIVGFGDHSAAQTDFLDITLSSAGTQRYIGIYGTTSNTITKVEGAEAPLASFPATPANTAIIGYVLVGDAVIGTTPDLSGYMLKSSKATAADIVTGTEDTKYITPLGLKSSGVIRGINDINYSGQWHFNIGSGARASVAGLNGIIWFIPFHVGKDQIYTDIGLNVGTGDAASNIRVALYNSDSVGLIGTLIEDSGNISSATSGFKSVAFSTPRQVLASNKIYYRAVQCSSSAISLVYNILINIRGETTGLNSSLKILSQAFGAFPANGSAAVANASVLNFQIGLKAQ